MEGLGGVTLSLRLSRIASHVPSGARLLDVGSDHAYLPLHLLAVGKIDFAVAGEVVEGPYQAAITNARASTFSDRLSVRLANGLAAMAPEDKIDTVTIAGMGGGLISEILEAGKDCLSEINRLILQPNNREDVLRQWLHRNGFSIVTEEIISEKGKFYEIIVAEAGDQELTDQDIRFGPYLRRAVSPLFSQRWRLEKDKYQMALDRIPLAKEAERHALVQKIRSIEEVLHASE